MVVPILLKEALVCPLLKKLLLDPITLGNFHPVSNLIFLGKVVEKVVAQQLQQVLGEADHLNLFLLGFRPGEGTEATLVALLGDAWQEQSRCSTLVFPLLDLSATSDNITFWSSSVGWEWAAQYGLIPFLPSRPIPVSVDWEWEDLPAASTMWALVWFRTLSTPI